MEACLVHRGLSGHWSSHKIALGEEDSDYHLASLDAFGDSIEVSITRPISSTLSAILRTWMKSVLTNTHVPTDRRANTFYLEACEASVYVESFPWNILNPTRPSMLLESTKDCRRRWIHLRPEVTFKIDNAELKIQSVQPTVENERPDKVQVDSSRAHDGFEDSQAGLRFKEKQDSGAPMASDIRVAVNTPPPWAETTVMETPVTDRHYTIAEMDPFVDGVGTRGGRVSGASTAKQDSVSALRKQGQSIEKEQPAKSSALGNVDVEVRKGSLDTGNEDSNRDRSRLGLHKNQHSDNQGSHQAAAASTGDPEDVQSKQLDTIAGVEQHSDTGITKSAGADIEYLQTSLLDGAQDSVHRSAEDLLRMSTDGQNQPSQPCDTNSSASDIEAYDQLDELVPRSVTLPRLMRDKAAARRGTDPKSRKHDETQDESSEDSQPRKRQKRPGNKSTTKVAKEDTQDSMKSNIKSKVPPSAQTPVCSQSSSTQTSQASPILASTSSQRSAPQGTTSATASQGERINVAFASSTSVDGSPDFMSFLAKHNIRKVRSVAECQILCVGRGEVKSTGNVMLSMLTGKEIVADSWITRSAKQGKLLDFSLFRVKDLERKREWRTTLNNVIERSRQGVRLFQGWTFNFTPNARRELGKNFVAVKEIALNAGAACVRGFAPRKAPEVTPSTIVIASTRDKDVHALYERGWRSYTKDLITVSVLRGHLDVRSEEFAVTSEKSELYGRHGTRKR
ncbi:MAG: hypothetical protein Q9190_004662 [Brigantiaea leucoxantha]